MKTIIKHGCVETYQVTCEACDCIFQYTDEDVFEVNEDYDFRSKVSCPDCGSYIKHYYGNKIEDEN